MKKVILIIVVLALTFALTGCGLSKQKYNDELETCESIFVRSFYTSRNYSCSELESVEVLPSGALEIIHNSGRIDITSDEWHVTIMPNEEEDN